MPRRLLDPLAFHPMNRVYLRLSLLVSLLGFVACGGPSSSLVYLESAGSLNPNRKGESSPVNVRIYQLTDAQAFEAAEFDALWEGDAAVLGASLVGTASETDLDASSHGLIKLQLDSKTRFVGVMGLFTDESEDKGWRDCVAVGEVEDFTFYFEGYKIVRRDR